MAFFDSVGEKITSFGNDALNKGRNLKEGLDLKSQLKGCEEELKNAYIEIGKQYYNNNKDNVPADMTALFARVDEANATIDTLSEKLRASTGKTLCPQCKQEIVATSVFCPKCGAKVAEDAPDAAPAANTCSKCGAVVKEGSLFCESCGNKLS